MNIAKEEQILSRRLKDLANTSYQKGICTYTDFLNLNEQNIYYRVQKELQTAHRVLFGGYPEAERRMICFLPDETCQNYEFPIQCIEIMPSDKRFSENLSHRDFLGAVLNLGIERSRVGDILTADNAAYLFCTTNIALFIADNLIRVKHTAVIPKILHTLEGTFSISYEEITGTVPSLRLDAVLAVAFRTSRSSLSGLIQGGKVFINSKLTESNSHILKENDIVSVRGYGKFIYKNTTKQTKKGRYSISLLKYK